MSFQFLEMADSYWINFLLFSKTFLFLKYLILITITKRFEFSSYWVIHLQIKIRWNVLFHFYWTRFEAVLLINFWGWQILRFLHHCLQVHPRHSYPCHPQIYSHLLVISLRDDFYLFHILFSSNSYWWQTLNLQHRMCEDLMRKDFAWKLNSLLY
jgi:hypothetical protein